MIVELHERTKRSSEAPLLRKFGNLSKASDKNFRCDDSVGRRSVHSPESAGLGMEYVIFSWWEIVRCICATHVFPGGKSRKKSVEFKMYAASGNLFTDS